MQGGSPFRSAEPVAFNAHAPYAMTKGGPPSPCCRILLMPSQKLEKERCALMKVVQRSRRLSGWEYHGSSAGSAAERALA
eukprot:6037611-Prymnesium_polylepis.1